MLNRSASLVMSTSVLKALPIKFDIKRYSPSILYVPDQKIRPIALLDTLALETFGCLTLLYSDGFSHSY